MFPVVVVHGGAGDVPKERSETSTSGVCSAARAGYLLLQAGGSSMDAVVEAVTQMENNPAFNAGHLTNRTQNISKICVFLHVQHICTHLSYLMVFHHIF